MELTHSFTVPTEIGDAWALFMDLERVGGCFPGATVTEVTDDGFSGTVKVKLGPIALLYAGSGSFVAKEEQEHRAVIEAKGKDKRGNGTAGATVTVQLSPENDGTRADVVTDLAVTGKPAQFGRGVMQDVSDKLLGQFIACIERQLAGGQPEPVAAAVGAPLPEATIQDEREAARRPEIVTEAVPRLVHETGTPLSLAERVDLSKSEAAERATTNAASVAHADHADHVAHADHVSQTAGGTAAVSSAGAAQRTSPVVAAEDDALDLGSAVLPVLARRYGALAVAAAVGIVVGWLIGRRSSH